MSRLPGAWAWRPRHDGAAAWILDDYDREVLAFCCVRGDGSMTMRGLVSANLTVPAAVAMAVILRAGANIATQRIVT